MNRKAVRPVLCRRDFLARSAAASLVTGLSGSVVCAAGDNSDPLIASIQTEVIFEGRKTGTTWFHPRACLIPTARGHEVLMTMQTIGGSDVFGPVHWTTSVNGRTWSEPQPIGGLGRRQLDEDWEEGVCDVVPEYHGPTRTVLAVGHNVYYRNNVLARPQRRRWPVYVVRDELGQWTAPRRLDWDDPRGREIYTCGCGERYTTAARKVLIPISFSPAPEKPRSVTSLCCDFDGSALTVERAGAELTTDAGRGLLEPSIAFHNGVYYLTIRAEDDRGYVSTSNDGLSWRPQSPWCWDDGEPLSMSTTQQHWLVHRDGLFLVYTRRTEENAKVFRWRGPIFIAQVDTVRLRLIRATEQVVFPLRWQSPPDSKTVARMGNFHPVRVSLKESWITVGEESPANGWRGDTLLARIGWSRDNSS